MPMMAILAASLSQSQTIASGLAHIQTTWETAVGPMAISAEPRLPQRGNQAHSSLCVFLFERWRNHSRSPPGSPADGHHPTFQSAIELVGDLVQNPIGCSVIRLALVSRALETLEKNATKDVSFLNLLASTRAGITWYRKHAGKKQCLSEAPCLQ